MSAYVVVGTVGAIGCGAETVLRSAEGIFRPTSGTIYIFFKVDAFKLVIEN